MSTLASVFVSNICLSPHCTFLNFFSPNLLLILVKGGQAKIQWPNLVLSYLAYSAANLQNEQGRWYKNLKIRCSWSKKMTRPKFFLIYKPFKKYQSPPSYITVKFLLSVAKPSHFVAIIYYLFLIYIDSFVYFFLQYVFLLIYQGILLQIKMSIK